MSRFVWSALFAGLALAALWFALRTEGGGNDRRATELAPRAGAAGEIGGSAAATAKAARAAAPEPGASPPAPVPLASTPAASSSSDPFGAFLNTQRPASASIPPVSANQSPASDPFKAALEESEKRRAAARASPFGTATQH